MNEILISVLKWLLGGGGLLALYFAIATIAVRRRAHLIDVYQSAFALLDSPEMRAARRYVYNLEKANPDRTQYLTEKWQALDEVTDPRDREVWTANQTKAERVARSFDQLGLLVREGIIPINIIARFYASPALRCWHNLRPYLEAERRARNQKGHMWEWEHFVADVLIPQLRGNKGVWAGVSIHDDLEGYCNKVEHELRTMYRDTDYNPGQHLWEIAPWYDCRKW